MCEGAYVHVFKNKHFRDSKLINLSKIQMNFTDFESSRRILFCKNAIAWFNFSPF